VVGNRIEYVAMNACEEDLWWYKVLHQHVLSSIVQEFGNNKNIRIIDAGCGTGGLLQFLKENGYSNFVGLDISYDAIEFSSKKGLNVFQGDVKDIGQSFTKDSADVIISNDMLYFFEKEIQVKVLKQFYGILKINGICILNLPAFDALSGTHDVAVGINKRFNLTEVQRIFKNVGFIEKTHFHWPFILSPIILAIRTLQRFVVNSKKQDHIKSDVKMPSKFINNVLYAITKAEANLPFRGFFGSSLFITAIKIK
jgi:SAM-dependent methyltransferase